MSTPPALSANPANFQPFSFIDWGNSIASTGPAVAVYTGNWTHALKFNRLNVTIIADQTGSLDVYHALYEGAPIYQQTFAYPVAGTGSTFDIRLVSAWYTIVFTPVANITNYTISSKVSMF